MSDCTLSPDESRRTSLISVLPSVSFGQLPKEERKAITKVVHPEVLKGSFEHAAICTSEIGSMLACFDAKDWETAECKEEIRLMQACVQRHKKDPVREGGGARSFRLPRERMP